jgi:hypothetical protein
MNMRYDSGTVTVVSERVERLHEVAPHAVGAGRDAAQELAGRPGDAPVHPHRPLHLLLLAVPLGRRWMRGPGGRGRGNDCPAMRSGKAGPRRRDGQDRGGREVPGQGGGGGRRRREGRRGSCHFSGPRRSRERQDKSVRGRRADTAARGASDHAAASAKNRDLSTSTAVVGFGTLVRLGSLSSGDLGPAIRVPLWTSSR